MPEGQRMTEHEVELSHWYDATPERVFHAWIDADALAQWMGPFNTKTEVHEQDLRVGGTFRWTIYEDCLLYTSPSPRDQRGSRMPSSA